MEYLILGLIIIFLWIVKFIYNWIKVKIFLLVTNTKGNSFIYTILYMLGKREIKDTLDRPS